MADQERVKIVTWTSKEGDVTDSWEFPESYSADRAKDVVLSDMLAQAESDEEREEILAGHLEVK